MSKLREEIRKVITEAILELNSRDLLLAGQFNMQTAEVNSQSWDDLAEYQQHCPEVYYRYFYSLLAIDAAEASNQQAVMTAMSRIITQHKRITQLHEQLSKANTEDLLYKCLHFANSILSAAEALSAQAYELKNSAEDNFLYSSDMNSAIASEPPCETPQPPQQPPQPPQQPPQPPQPPQQPPEYFSYIVF